MVEFKCVCCKSALRMKSFPENGRTTCPICKSEVDIKCAYEKEQTEILRDLFGYIKLVSQILIATPIVAAAIWLAINLLAA